MSKNKTADTAPTKENNQILTPKKFSTSLAKLEKFTNTTDEDLEIEEVGVNGGFWGLGDHKVTGQEFNTRITAIQKNLQILNTADQEIRKHFSSIYTALDSLDKEYIGAILVNIKSIEKTSEGVSDAQKKISKMVGIQAKTLQALENFKAKLDQLDHLTEIDTIWEECRQWHTETIALSNIIDTLGIESEKTGQKLIDIENHAQGLKAALGMVSGDLEEQMCRIDALTDFMNELDKMAHLNDVDELWNKALTNEGRIALLEEDAKSISAELLANEKVMEENRAAIDANKTAIEDNKAAIDTNKTAIEENKTSIQENHVCIAATRKAVEKNQNEIDALTEYTDQLKALEHLNEVDHLWTIAEVHSHQIENAEAQTASLAETMNREQAALKQSIDQNQEDLLVAMAEEHEKNEIALQKASQKIKYAFIAAGSGIGLAVIELVLLLLKVI